MVSDSGASCVLMVLHGQGRGRGGIRYAQPFLDHLARRAPELNERVQVHRTGQGPAKLDGAAAVVFFLGDPLRDRHPECYAEAAEIAGEARARGVRVVNSPESLSSKKSDQARIWQQAGLPTPPQHPFRDRDELDALLEAASFPAVVKADLYHGQRGMGSFDDPGSVSSMADAGKVLYPGTLAPFVDVREGHRQTDPTSIWARLYHRKRVLVFGDQVKTHNVLFSASPIIPDFPSMLFHLKAWGPEKQHYEKFLLKGTCAVLRRWNRADLGERMAYSSLRLHTLGRSALAENTRYWLSEESHSEVMKAAARALGFEIANIDYSTLADGSVVLWEANPYFPLRYFPTIPLPGVDTEERFSLTFGGLERFLVSLLP